MRDFDKQMEMVLYHSDEGDVSVDAYIMNDSLWITQKAMAELLGYRFRIFQNILPIYMMKVNWIRRQLFPKWK